MGAISHRKAVSTIFSKPRQRRFQSIGAERLYPVAPGKPFWLEVYGSLKTAPPERFYRAADWVGGFR